jgi:GAF domain-containing protein
VDVHDERLSKALTSLAVALLNDTSLKGDLETLARVSCQLIEECSGASISMLVDGTPSTVAVTNRIALELDLVQYDAGDGPCITALGGEVIRIGHLAADEQFPHFAHGAADRRVQSVLSTPAIDHGEVVGSLNLYSRQRDAFGEQARRVALVMAAEVAHAVVRSVTLSKARTTRDRLQEQHDEETLVARAQGVLIALHDCSTAQAADLIRAAADTNGERLAITAERILAAVRDDVETANRLEGSAGP